MIRFHLMRLVLLAGLVLGVGASVIAWGQQGPGTIDFIGAFCTDANANCNQYCMSDYGLQSNYCWATKCTENKNIGAKVCERKTTLLTTCRSSQVTLVSCTGCTAWMCSPLKQPDAGHPYPWCDFGQTCTCRADGGDWQGSWDQWRTCTG
jgi:hypothetical protein